MRFTSPYPPPWPLGDDASVYQYVYGNPNLKPAADYTLYVDGVSGAQCSYYEFKRRVDRAALALRSPTPRGLGLRESGEVIGILSANCVDYCVLFHSLLALAVPLVPLSSYATPNELGHLLKSAKVTRIFASPSLLGLARRAAPSVGIKEKRIHVLGDSMSGAVGLSAVTKNFEGQEIADSHRPVSRDTLAYFLFSSGTSGPPKAVMLSHGNICDMMSQGLIVGAELLKLVPRDPNAGAVPSLCVLPLHHTYGLTTAIFRPLLSLTTAIILPKWDVNVVLNTIERYKIQRISLVPSMALTFIDAQRIRKADLSSLESIGSGAAYLPPSVAQELKNIAPGADLVAFQGYGMSEATVTISAPHPTEFVTPVHMYEAGYVGVLFPGLEGRVLRPDGSEADVNEPGELLVRGGVVAMGYFGNEKATRETFIADGWLRTGDRFRVDAEGNLFFDDRVKDTLKISGMQVAPSEIEDTILAHPDHLVSDACVAGVSGGRTSDEKIPRAWVVLAPAGVARGQAETIAAIDEWVKKMLSKYKWLRGGIEVVESIPKSPTGKVLRRVLQDQHEKTPKKLRAKL